MKFTDYLAIYAAALSTLVFAWNLVQSRPRMKVNVMFGIESSGETVTTGVYIFIRNVSSHDLHVASVDILYPYKTATFVDRLGHAWRYKTLPLRIGWVYSSLSYLSVKSGCPMSVAPRSSHKIFIPQPVLDGVLSEATAPVIMACVHDQLWHRVYSRKFNCESHGPVTVGTS